MNCTRLRVSVRESRDVVTPCVVMPHRFPVIGSRPLPSTLSPPPCAARFSRMKRTTILLALAALVASCSSGSTTPSHIILLANPLTWDYGNVNLSDSSAPKDFTITNAGDSPTTSFANALSGPNAGDYTIIADGCAAAGAVVAGDTCTIRVEFTPVSSIGTKDATLDVVAQPGSAHVHVTLSGVALP